MRGLAHQIQMFTRFLCANPSIIDSNNVVGTSVGTQDSNHDCKIVTQETMTPWNHQSI
jgi:hypothetical protein